MKRHSDNRKGQDSQPEYLMNNPEIMGIKKDSEHLQNESNDMTEVINNETESEPYNIDKRSKKFIRFCGERRSLRKIRPGRLKLISENGEQYASIQCKTGDCPEDKTERNELWLRNYNGENKNDDFEFNKPYTCKFSFRIPENFPLSPTRLVIGQWKFNRQDESEEKGPSPILAQRIKKIDGKYYLVVTDSHREQIGEKIPLDDIKGKWVDMEYKINFSDKEDIESSVEIIANIGGKKVNIFKGGYKIRDDENKLKLNPDKPHTGYFKFGLYRDNYDYAKKKLKKDSKLNRKQKKIGIQEIERAQSSESENPMEIHFKGFSMEDDTQPEIERLKGKLNDEQYDKVEYLTRLFKKGDINEIYTKFLKLDKDYIEYIKNHEESRDISKELEFLQNPNYIENTKKEYKELFEKLKADENISKLIEAIEQQDIEQIINLEKGAKNLRKKLKKLKKYEKGELINLPNGLSFELSTKQEEKTISENIKLGDDEYFIKTHVERNADYKQYVSSLLEMRKLFKNKGINIKYVKRSTWLVNKEFLKAYEQEFLIPKYGDKYKKIQSIKVLDDTASAEIFYQIKEGTNPYDEKDEKKSPLRFIKDKKDLLGYVTQDDEHLKSFNEAEMWLDLDKLSQEKQDGGNSSTEKSTNNNSEEQIKEKLPSSEQIEQEYAEVLVKLIGNDENFKELLEGKNYLSKI